MYKTTLLVGSPSDVAENLTVFFAQNGYPNVYALAIHGNQLKNEDPIASHADMLTTYEQKHKDKILTPPLHFVIEDHPITILIIGDTTGLTFTKYSVGKRIILFVDMKTSVYDEPY